MSNVSCNDCVWLCDVSNRFIWLLNDKEGKKHFLLENQKFFLQYFRFTSWQEVVDSGITSIFMNTVLNIWQVLRFTKVASGSLWSLSRWLWWVWGALPWTTRSSWQVSLHYKLLYTHTSVLLKVARTVSMITIQRFGDTMLRVAPGHRSSTWGQRGAIMLSVSSIIMTIVNKI